MSEWQEVSLIICKAVWMVIFVVLVILGIAMLIQLGVGIVMGVFR